MWIQVSPVPGIFIENCLADARLCNEYEVWLSV